MTFVTVSHAARNARAAGARFNGRRLHSRVASARFAHTMARIVVVEEDALIRELIVEWLRGAGHSVTACQRIDALPDQDSDLLIVDVVHPRHGGCIALRAAQAAHPDKPLIAISGHFTAGSIASSTACGLGVRRVIGKPFSRDQLLRVVDDVIRNAAEA
jgi:two-component system, NtrC family, response regulator AtoC